MLTIVTTLTSLHYGFDITVSRWNPTAAFHTAAPKNIPMNILHEREAPFIVGAGMGVGVDTVTARGAIFFSAGFHTFVART